MDRRNFVKSAMYFTVASATLGLQACGGSSSSSAAAGSDKGKFSFSHGVASGDPKENSIVFWTRCINSSGTEDIALKLEVSKSAAFDSLVASVSLVASSTYDFTVRAKVTNLTPSTPYFYRFVAGQDISTVGQSKTTPAATATPAELKFAWLTCQDWSVNHWGAMEMLAKEDIEFFVHLGDYIYESVGASFQAGIAEAAHKAITLADGIKYGGSAIYANSVNDYRSLYKTYRSDARLQALHAKCPMIAIWDDHEFSDDCWQDHQTYTNENKQETSRRRNANQAWAEYMPVDFGDVSFDLNKAGYDNIRIYRDFKFGSLMHLVMTDQRLYRDDHVVPEQTFARLLGRDPVNGNDSVGSRYFVPQTWITEYEKLAATSLQRPPSILGTTQSQWWKDTMKASTATWKVWGNEVTLNRSYLDMRNAAPAPYNNLYIVNADTWDGYPRHKAEILGFIKANNIKNVVAVTGDLHAFQCGVVRDTQDTATGTPVLVDFVAAGISSGSFYSYLKQNSAGTPLAALVTNPQTYDGVMRANNPDFAYLDHDAQGYALATVTANSFNVVFKKVKPLNADGTKPTDPLLKSTKISLAAGSLTPVVTDNV